MEINGYEIETFNVYGLDTKSNKSTCPKCSHTRKKKKQKCLMTVWERGLGTCQHCGVVLQLHTYKNNLETKNQLFEQDLLEASTQKPIDQEQFMLLEELYKQTDKLILRVDAMMHNKIQIQSLLKDMEKVEQDIEKIKNNFRIINGGH